MVGVIDYTYLGGVYDEQGMVESSWSKSDQDCGAVCGSYDWNSRTDLGSELDGSAECLRTGRSTEPAYKCGRTSGGGRIKDVIEWQGQTSL